MNTYDNWTTVESRKIKKKRPDLVSYSTENKINNINKINKINKITDYDKYEPNISNMGNESLKKLMCKNILTNGKCSYENKCLYAHNLNEQNMDHKRKLVYDIIMGRIPYINNDIQIDDEIYKIFIQLCKICDLCSKNKCPGGFNCKHGVFDKQYQVCADDLRDGVCYNITCSKIHLTNKGIKSLKELKLNFNLNDFENNKLIDYDDYKRSKYIKETGDINITENIDNYNDNMNIDNINRIFAKKQDINKNTTDCETESDNNSTGSVERIKEYLNYDSESDDCDVSIFS